MNRRFLPSMNALNAFEAVARLGRFTLAADELGLTQGAVSRQILALEAALDLKLFERGRDGARLTEAGAAYAAEIGPALRRISNATLNMITTKGHGGTIVLGILPTLGTRWLVPRLPRFFELHPDIGINFMTRLESRDLVQDGLGAAILIGIAAATILRIVFALTTTQLLASARITEPRDLTRFQLLHLRSRPNGWRRWLAANGVDQPDVAGMSFEQFSMVSQAAMADMGIAVLPDFLIGEELASGRLVPVFERTVRSDMAYYFVYPQANADNPAVAALSAWLADEVRRFKADRSASAALAVSAGA